MHNCLLLRKNVRSISKLKISGVNTQFMLTIDKIVIRVHIPYFICTYLHSILEKYKLFTNNPSTYRVLFRFKTLLYILLPLSMSVSSRREFVKIGIPLFIKVFFV